MLINVINLQRRPDRKLSIIQHFDKLNLLYKFWDGYDDRSILGFKNVPQSHKSVVRDAKNKNLELVAIAEDDTRFSHQNSMDVFLKKAPKDFDLYFGMIYSGNIQDDRITHGFSGMQFYVIHSRFYDTFLSADPNKHIDTWLGERCHEYQYYVCDPFICYGESGYSDNFKKQWVLEEEKLPRNIYRG